MGPALIEQLVLKDQDDDQDRAVTVASDSRPDDLDLVSIGIYIRHTVYL